VERQQSKKRDFVPVFLTDSCEFDCFRNRGYLFEYLPPVPRHRMNGRSSWQDYAAERLELLMRKWGFSEIIVFGKDAFGRPADEIVVRDAINPAEIPLEMTLPEGPDRAPARRRSRTSKRAAGTVPKSGKKRRRTTRPAARRNGSGTG
jgi:hypothetical protein